MTTAIIIGGLTLIAFYMLALGLAKMGDDEDDLSDTDHAPEVEIDRRVTSVWIGGNHFEF